MPSIQQLPTPEASPRNKGKATPPLTSQTSSDNSMASKEEETGYVSRSKSASRRRKRQDYRQRNAQSKVEAGKTKANSQVMASVPEEEQSSSLNRKQAHTTYMDEEEWLDNPSTEDTTEQQPFEHIKPPSQSMDGPVTYARMMRGEIPWRGAAPWQPYHTTQGVDSKTRAPDPMEQDGLKLRLELNLDIEIELKAHIHGDITLALL